MNRIITLVLISCLVLTYVEDVCALAPGSGFTRTDKGEPQSLEDLIIPQVLPIKYRGISTIGTVMGCKNGKDYWVKFSNFFIQNEWGILKTCMSADSRIVRAVAMGEDIGIREFAYSSDLVSDVQVRVRGGPYIIFEKLDGECLENYILRRGSSVPEEERLNIARQSAEIMLAVHGVGILHRDFAMRNLWREPSGRIRLLDFGFSWYINTPILSFMDELWFFPKESERRLKGYNGSPDKQFDIFSFGIFLLELFRGYQLPREPNLTQEIASLRETNPGLAEVMAKCLADRKARYTDFSEVFRDLNRLISEEEKEGKRAVPEGV